jgi:hypothetical protein
VLAAIIALGLLTAAVLPALAAQPSPKPGHGPRAPKVPATPITVNGTVVATTDAHGRTVHTVTADGQTYTLGAGPRWWWGDGGPLADAVGKDVTIVGELRPGSQEIDVETIDGDAWRTWVGRPPRAGGPGPVGAKHPGWMAWRAAHADGHPGRGRGQGLGLGRAHAPGQLKKAAEAAASATPTP